MVARQKFRGNDILSCLSFRSLAEVWASHLRRRLVIKGVVRSISVRKSKGSWRVTKVSMSESGVASLRA
jgi:hypothetical protein